MGRGQLSEDEEQREALQFFLRILSAAKECEAQKKESLQEALSKAVRISPTLSHRL